MEVNSWEEKGKKNSLALFHKASENIPAYKKFLKSNKINPKSIKAFSDFEELPPTNKKNYIDKYTLQERVWGGEFEKNTLISSSSGTTGKPYYWPNAETDIQHGREIHEEIFNVFDLQNKKTLLIICFSMGTWIAGVYTLLSSYLTSKNFPYAIVTTGFDKKATLQVLKDIAPQFEQVVVAGYPTFVKDIIDSSGNVDTKKTKFIFAGEGFSESWRDALTKRKKTELYVDAVSILGSADSAIMGFETPFTIFVRREASKSKKFRKDIFKSEKLASLFAFLPEKRWFEEKEGNLLLTANKNHPLIRYEIGDQGGVLNQNLVRSKIKNISIVDKKLSKWHSEEKHHKLPLVYTFGREKFTITLFAANIYPENIKDALIQNNLKEIVTTNYLAQTKYDNNQDTYLHIHIELKKNINPSKQLEGKISQAIVSSMRKSNSEYEKIFQEYGEKVIPKITTYKYSDPKMFSKKSIRKTS